MIYSYDRVTSLQRKVKLFIWCFLDGGLCYLIDDRVTNTAPGSAYRIMDKDFYTLLEELFQ